MAVGADPVAGAEARALSGRRGSGDEYRGSSFGRPPSSPARPPGGRAEEGGEGRVGPTLHRRTTVIPGPMAVFLTIVARIERRVVATRGGSGGGRGGWWRPDDCGDDDGNLRWWRQDLGGVGPGLFLFC